MIIEIRPGIADLVEKNDGYCPCAAIKTKNTKCPCKAFRKQKEGECYCGRYRKVETDED